MGGTVNGAFVGRFEDSSRVDDELGTHDGARVAMNIGTFVGANVLGKTEGRGDGSLVTGFADGATDGFCEGEGVGANDGAIILVGRELGTEVGGDDGCFVGLREG